MRQYYLDLTGKLPTPGEVQSFLAKDDAERARFVAAIGKDRPVVLKGIVENNNHKLRAGQFVTAFVPLPVEIAELSLPEGAVVEEKGEAFVFVQPDPAKPVFEQRRVIVVRRRQNVVHVASSPALRK